MCNKRSVCAGFLHSAGFHNRMVFHSAARRRSVLGVVLGVPVVLRVLVS